MDALRPMREPGTSWVSDPPARRMGRPNPVCRRGGSEETQRSNMAHPAMAFASVRSLDSAEGTPPGEASGSGVFRTQSVSAGMAWGWSSVMGSLLGYMEVLRQAARAAEAAKLLHAAAEDPALSVLLPVYVIALAWLAHRLTRRRRPSRRSRSRSPRPMTGLPSLCRAVTIIAVDLIVALARVAGRSTFHSGRRF